MIILTQENVFRAGFDGHYFSFLFFFFLLTSLRTLFTRPDVTRTMVTMYKININTSIPSVKRWSRISVMIRRAQVVKTNSWAQRVSNVTHYVSNRTIDFRNSSREPALRGSISVLFSVSRLRGNNNYYGLVGNFTFIRSTLVAWHCGFFVAHSIHS